MELFVCECGSKPEFIKLFKKNRYDGYVKCRQCGKETKAYTSKQNAIKAWNNMHFARG